MRKILNKIFNFAAYYSGINYICGFFLNDKIFVLNYHSVVDTKDNQLGWMYPNLTIDIGVFEKQMKYLNARGHTFIKISDLPDVIENNYIKPTIVYFDDGFKDNLTSVLPILKKYNIPANIFITTEIADKINFLWTLKYRFFLQGSGYNRTQIEGEVSRLKNLPQGDREKKLSNIYAKNNFYFNETDFDIFLNWDDIFLLSKNNIEIGSHGVSHLNLPELSSELLCKEIINSKKILEQKLNQNIVSFSYPYGKWNDDVNHQLKNYDYKFAVSVGEGLNDRNIIGKELVILKNISIKPHYNIIDFKVQLYARNLIKRQ